MSNHQSTTSITLKLDKLTSINLPDDLNLMSRFVLEEQGDWFEDELPFVRRLLKPGMQVIDIGANYGCYALSMANAVLQTDSKLPQGQVYAFEPCIDTFEMLSSSKELNNFAHLNLIHSGLSNQAGQATLYKSHNSELNSLHPKENSQQEQETIQLKTLDECLDEFAWKNIDFLKLDAEGEERNILLGAKRAFTELSPLVMFELKHGKQVHHELISDFERMGYNCFILNKALDILLPFNANSIDGYQLNLFACKQDTAEKLEQQGLLSQQAFPVSMTSNQYALKTIEESYAVIFNDYKNSMTVFSDKPKDTATKMEYLHQWQASYVMLKNMLKNACDKETNSIELYSAYIRFSLLLGKRQEAVSNLHSLLSLTDMSKNNHLSQLKNSQPMIAPIADYDNVCHNWNTGSLLDSSWLRAAALHTYIQHHAFSCYFSNKKILEKLQELNAFSFIKAPYMQARERLITQLVQKHNAKNNA